jgi:hypothetical protein
VQATGLILLVMILAAPAYRNLGRYSDFYDGGVYLESTRMLAAGYAPYREVFISQPPAWLKLIQWSFALFGQSMRGAQMLTVSTLVLTTLGIGFIVLDRGFWLGSALVCIIILLSPLTFFWAREVTGELPSAAFAAVALAMAGRYASSGRRLWLGFGALALAGALSIKLFSLYAVPPMLLIAATRWDSAGELRQKIWRPATDTLLVLGIIFAAVLALASAYGVREVWTEAVAFHLGSRAGLSLARNWSLIVATVSGDPALLSVLPLALCAALESWIGWAALGWLALTLIGLLNQHPLFTHHVVALVPPLALTAGIGFGALWKLGRRLRIHQASVRSDDYANDYGRLIGIAVCATSFVLFAAVCRGGLAGRIDQRWILAHWHPPTADLDVAAELARITNNSAFVLTDAPGIAFWSARQVPPWLADTSLKRIDNRYLSTADIKNEVERYQVKAVLLWTGRLERLPGLVAWLEQTFPIRRSYGPHGVLYLRP